MALAPRKKVGQVIAARDWSWRWLKGSIAAAAVAWFVSLPMILHHFDRLNPWAIVASIVLAPIVFFALIGGVLKVVLTLACPPMAAVWATTAAWPIWAMHHAVEWLGRLPLSDVTLKPPPVALTLLYYAVLLAALHPKLSKRVRRLAVVAACATILVGPVVVTAMVRHHPDETRVTILSVGAGSCAIIETNDGGTAVIDAGSSGSSELYRSVIEPYFRTRAVRGVGAAIVSHADIDHYGAFADLAQDRAVAATYLTPYFLADDSPSAQELAREMPRQQVVTGPKTIRLTADTTLEILWPPPDLDLDSNDSSMVVKLNVAGRSVLFPGDIQSAAMTALLADPPAIKADVLIAPHHGSFEDATPAFVTAVSPSTIVSSDDRTPSSKQRTFDEAIAPLPIFHTRDHGAITILIKRDGTLTVTPFRP